MEHRWVAAGSAPMTEDQALEWAADSSAEVVTRTELQVVTHALFCAVCDQFMGDAPEQCPGPPHPSLFPHHWRVKTTMMLDETEARDVYLERGDHFGLAMPQALNIYCDLCGEEFDPTLGRCSERSVLRADGSTISDDELDRFMTEANDGADPVLPLVWEEVRWIGHDRWLCMADAGIPLEAYRAVIDSLAIVGRTVNGTVDGYPFIACFTEADTPVPVEVSKDADGIQAVRVCWTNDVDVIDGRWETIGRLPISSGRCRVWDPRHHSSDEAFALEIPSAFYKAQIFLFDSDCLAMRILREIPAIQSNPR